LTPWDLGEALADKVVVTGGADSVGRVIAERFLARGDKVHICDIRPQALQETLAANPAMTGTLANVGDHEAVVRVFREAAAEMGDVSVLVNNVGIAGPNAAIEDIVIGDWEESLRVNLGGAFFCMQQAIPGMKRRGGGAIVNFSTGSTRTRLPHRTPYVVSKFGVEGLTLNAARELGPFHIRCNAILPGMINNARMRGIVAAKAAQSGGAIAEVQQNYLKYISMHVQIEPSELADMVVFLASDAARKITGELIAVSGNLEWEE
jgi:NAD(P)-dependent dehydrogenase (short-subunit alcohol dehydrogenase family)